MSRSNRIEFTEQEILNFGLDDEQVKPPTSIRGQLQWTGSAWVRENSCQVALKITVVGDVMYVGIAPIGTAQSAAAWQVKKIDESVTDELIVTWADGNANYDNVATDLTALSYS